MLEVVVFTLKNDVVTESTEVLLADMAGLSENDLIQKMESFGYTAVIKISLESANRVMMLSFTRRKIYDDKLSAF